MRYTANGQLDRTFGSNGYVTLTVEGDGDDTFPYGIAVDANNNIVVAGCNEDSGVMALVRFTANGELDGTFGSGGIVTESFACQAQAVTIDDDGNILVSGLAANGENLVVARSPATAIWTTRSAQARACSTARATPTTSSTRLVPIRCNYSPRPPIRWATRSSWLARAGRARTA